MKIKNIFLALLTALILMPVINAITIDTGAVLGGYTQQGSKNGVYINFSISKLVSEACVDDQCSGDCPEHAWLVYDINDSEIVRVNCTGSCCPFADVLIPNNEKVCLSFGDRSGDAKYTSGRELVGTYGYPYDSNDLYIDSGCNYDEAVVNPNAHFWDLRNLTYVDAPSNVAPSITVVSPDNDYVFNENLTAEFNPSDADNDTLNCSLYIDGFLNTTNNGILQGANTILNASGMVNDGNYTWHVNCTDGALHGSSTPRNYVLDTINPLINFNRPEPDNSTYQNHSLTVNSTCVNSNLDSFNLTAYNDSALTEVISSINKENINATVWKEDSYVFNFANDHTKYIEAVCSDGANEARKVVRLEFDTTDPSFADLANDASSANIGDTVKFNVTTTDNSLVSYSFSQNQSGTFVATTPSSISGVNQLLEENVNVSTVKDTNICGFFTVTDEAGNQNTSALTCFTTVNNVPVLNPIPDGSNVLDEVFTYQTVCTDGDTDPLSYYISDLSINVGGLISDTPTTTGTTNVQVFCSDLTINSTRNFTYSVSQGDQGAGVHNLLEESGTGLAVFFDRIQSPIASFLLLIIIAVGLSAIVFALMGIIPAFLRFKK